jgi:hypothetical protein
MQDPLTVQLICGIWADIDDAVKNGLAWLAPDGQPHPALAEALIVKDEQINKVDKWDSDSSEEGPYGQCRIRESGSVSDFMYRYTLSYDELRALTKDSVKGWAEAVRKQELTYAMERYAAAAGEARPYWPDQLFRVAPGGSGKRRCVVFSSSASPPKTVPDSWRSADLDRTVKLDAVRQQGPIEALVFRIAGGPYVRRPADLSLGWMPAGDYGAELILTGQLEFVGTEVKDNIIGIKMN